MDKKTTRNLSVVGQARIYFGHQSVGKNIVAGIEALQGQAGGRDINIIELHDENDYPAAFLLHSKVGENTDPGSKCDDFSSIIDTRLAGKIDYAMLKFCYIDINGRTDVDAVFGHYRRTMDGLKKRHPDITFIHVTAPLRHSERSIGVWVREMLGRPNRSKLDNISRNAFNEMLRSTYRDDPVFDLAASESTYPDGRRETFKYKGMSYYGLIGSYTDDGGHLNSLGQRHVAADLLQLLASVIESDQTY